MSKVIFKMTFKHPNLKDTKIKNISHVEYIATRPGTDKTITEADLKRELEKGIEDITSDNVTYARYIDERPRSHGLFGQDGIENLDEVKKELSNVSGYVWRCIVSLKEEDAKELGYTNKEQWQDMLRKKIPDMANKMGISITNLRWVAAVHMEKGHPHAHIMLWEKEPRRTIGVISGKALSGIRKLFTDEIFEEKRFMLLNEKNMMRDLIRDLARNNIRDVIELIKEVRETGQELITFLNGMVHEGIAPKLYSEEEKEIAKMLLNVSKKMPGHGRVAFMYMPEDVKVEVKAIADFILKQPVFAASLEKNLKAVEELTRMYTGIDNAINNAKYNSYEDIRTRVCQIILKGAFEIQKDINNNLHRNYDMNLAIINDIWKSAWKVLERQRMQTEAQAEYMRRQLNKRDSISQSKKAIKEYIRKAKDRSSLYVDEELEK